MYSFKKRWYEFALPVSCYKRRTLEILHSVSVENQWIPPEKQKTKNTQHTQVLRGASSPNAGSLDHTMGATESPRHTSSSAEATRGRSNFRPSFLIKKRPWAHIFVCVRVCS